MKFLVVSVAALLSTAASAETHQYRVLFGGDDVGGLEVETAGNTSGAPAETTDDRDAEDDEGR